MLQDKHLFEFFFISFSETSVSQVSVSVSDQIRDGDEMYGEMLQAVGIFRDQKSL